MKIKLSHIVFLVMVVTLGHFSALKVGLYQGKIWVDMPLHFIGGIMLGLGWIWVLGTSWSQNRLGSPSNHMIVFSIVSFTLLGSFVWELFEFGFWKLLPSIAYALKIFSSSVSDILSDMALGVLGGIVVAFTYLFKINNKQS